MSTPGLGNSKFGSLPKGFGRAVDLSSLARPTGQHSSAASSGNMSGDKSGDKSDASVIINVTENNLMTDFVEFSKKSPALIFIWSDRAKGSREMLGALDTLARQDDGAWRLGAISFDTQPELASALRVTAIPTAVALIKEQLLPIPQLPNDLPSLRAMIDRILEVAKEQGLTITRSAGGGDHKSPTAGAIPQEPDEPEEQEAYLAIERGDFDGAAKAYRRLLARKPNDALATQALAQCELMLRTGAVDPKKALDAAERDPDDLDAIMKASDIEVAMGRMEEAFARLISFIKRHPGPERKIAKEHLLSLFLVVPPEDPALLKARRELASALF